MRKPAFPVQSVLETRLNWACRPVTADASLSTDAVYDAMGCYAMSTTDIPSAATRCPVLTYAYVATRFGVEIADAGTRYELRYLPTRVLYDVRKCTVSTHLRTPYAMSGTDVADGTIFLRGRYAISGTELVVCLYLPPRATDKVQY
eukprot:2600904-Rhodomonas_salina.2